MASAARVLEAPTCRHCGGANPATRDDGFCCLGCHEVFALLHAEGLGRFYDLGGGEGHPVVRGPTDHKWLETLTRPGPLALDVQGVHCAACVWVIERLFRRQAGAQSIVVNPALGTIALVIGEGFPLERWVDDVEAIGYRLGPPLKATAPRDDLVWRMGVCVAIAMNTMIFGFAIYCGLTEGPLYRLFHGLDFALSLVSVLVGGTVFFRSAWASLRRGVLHLDLPIALGIVLVFASSTFTYGGRGGTTSYFDTLNVFIALMLVGRFLQERVVARNRALVLADDGAKGLLARRVRDGIVGLVPCTELAAGDLLLCSAGDIVPVDATLLGDDAASFSLDWISGESAPRAYPAGATVPAGAAASGPVRLACRTDFDRSALLALLARSAHRDDERARTTGWYASVTRIWVAAVLVLAAGAFVGWFLATGDAARALDVVAALLVVTCPCAFGISTPLAYELAQAGLRRAGLFVRTPAFLDRAAEVEDVVFDKTGTLTTGRLVVVDAEALLALPDRAVLHALAVRSTHPKSRAIAEVLAAIPLADADVTEHPGRGMELRANGSVWRLGKASWATATGAVPVLHGDVIFARDGEVLATVALREELRDDAVDEVHALAAAGYGTYLLTGDAWPAARSIAASCGIPYGHITALASPEDKAAWLRASGRTRALFVGDGINDSLVATAAFCAGTPAIDRPFMASRCDFYFVTPGLRPIREALHVARRLACVVRQNLALALAYNAVTVSLALAGLMTPLLGAVLMPLSSLSTVAFVATRLHRSQEWKS